MKAAFAADDEDYEPSAEPGATGPSAEERWQNGLEILCGDILAAAPYWTKEYRGWEQFECPSHIKTLVREAATAFASIAATVTGDGNAGDEAQAPNEPAADDAFAIPPELDRRTNRRSTAQ